MIFTHPKETDTAQLLDQWKEVFGDWNGFWEAFLETGFSARRCRCVMEGREILASLTWLDCHCAGQRIAYIYAVMTSPAHRGKGLCRKLLADTHSLLARQGYAAAMLVPAQAGLRTMYEGLGYRTCTFLDEFSCKANLMPAPVHAIGPEEFARRRKELLPPDSVLQEGENLDFLARQVQFYAGADFLLSAYQEEKKLTVPEFLGNTAATPGVLAALGCAEGRFRCPGRSIPFAMIHPLKETVTVPRYFGFAFD